MRVFIEKLINNKNITKDSEKDMDLSAYKLRPTKHFVLDYMRRWDYDMDSLRIVLETAEKIDKVGKNKFEAYIRTKSSSRKIIFVKDDEYKEIIVISGAEGK